MAMRRVCLDYHLVVEVDVPDDMEESAIADVACDKALEMSDEDFRWELEYDGYLVDYRR